MNGQRKPARHAPGAVLPDLDRRRFDRALAASVLLHVLLLMLHIETRGRPLPAPLPPRLDIVLAAPASPPADIPPAETPPAAAERSRPPAPDGAPPTPPMPTTFVASLMPAVPPPEPPARQPAARRTARPGQRRKAIPVQPPPVLIARKPPERESFSVPEPAPEQPAEAAAPTPPEPEAVTAAEPPTPAVEPQADEAALLALAEQQTREQEQRLEAQRAAEAAEARRLAEAQEARRQAEEAARQLVLARERQEAERLARQAAELAARQAQELAAAQAREHEERQEAQRQQALREAQAAEAAARRLAAEAESRRLAAEAEARRLAAEAEARRLASELEARRLAAEEDARRRLAAAPAVPAPIARSEPRADERSRERSALSGDACRQKVDGWYQPDAQVELYAATWRRRLSASAPFALLAEAMGGPFEAPVVTVAIRSDGSLDGITLHQSSGRPEIDAAVRRIIRMSAPFGRFPRELALDCDVIEFPSLWTLGNGLRLTWRGQ